MKILFLVPQMFLQGYKPLMKFKTGLSHTIYSIVNGFANRGHETYVFVQSAFCDGFEKGNLHVLPKKIFGIMPISIKYLRYYHNDTRMCNIPLRYRIHVLSYYLYGSYVEFILLKLKPDIVSVRGIGFVTRPFILACENTNTKYVVSLHGLISMVNDKNSLTTDIECEWERDLFRKSISDKFILTVISSGIKRRMLNNLGCKECNNIYVVNNGIDLNKIDDKIYDKANSIKCKYGITNDTKVLISAGSLSERKNQLQIIRAMSFISEIARENMKLLILGDGIIRDKLQEEIDKLGLNKTIVLCGHVPKNDMPIYLSISSVNIIASTDEGFGRVFVEAFLFGIPSVTFNDLDAVEDLYDPDAMVVVKERTDYALAQGIILATQREWDSNYIVRHGKRFSIDKMVDGYESLYKEMM